MNGGGGNTRGGKMKHNLPDKEFKAIVKQKTTIKHTHTKQKTQKTKTTWEKNRGTQ